MSAFNLFCVILFVYLFLWISINYIRLIVTSDRTMKCFYKLDEFVKQTVFPLAKNDIAITHIQWYLQTDDVNRKLVLIKQVKH